MLDITLFRVDQGGNPELVRESQRRRFKDPEIVDQIIQLDTEWRTGNFSIPIRLYLKNMIDESFQFNKFI